MKNFAIKLNTSNKYGFVASDQAYLTYAFIANLRNVS